MVSHFKVVLSQSPQQEFHPGSEVRGTLSVETWEPRRFHYIKVCLVGEAHTSITISDEDVTDFTVTDTRKYVNLQVVVWNWEQTRHREFQSGIHSFPFQFTIPTQQLPSSFNGGNSEMFGYIRYYVEGRIGTGQSEFDLTTETKFCLVEVVDVNLPTLQRPIGGSVRKTIHCWFCASGPITLTAKSPRRGYCIGEIIPLTVTVDNPSTKRIRVAAYLQQVATYRAEDQMSSISVEIMCVTSRTMRARRTVWQPGNDFIVPLKIKLGVARIAAVPTVASCDIITVEYVLVVEAVISRRKIPSIKIPLTIGNVPLREVSSPAPPPEVPPVISSQPQPSAPAYIPHLEPPSELISYPPLPYGLTSDPPPPPELTFDPPPSYELALQY